MVYELITQYLRDLLNIPDNASVSTSSLPSLNGHVYSLRVDERTYFVKCTSSLDRELEGLLMSKALGCCVPTVRAAVQTANNPFFQPFYISDFIRGLPLSEATANLASLRSLRKSLESMHSISVRRPIGSPPAQLSAISSVLKGKAKNLVYDLPWNTGYLNHGDFCPTNLIVEEKTADVYLIDWANWSFSDPVFDLGRLAVQGSSWTDSDISPLVRWVETLLSEAIPGCRDAPLKLKLGVLSELAGHSIEAAKAYGDLFSREVF